MNNCKTVTSLEPIIMRHRGMSREGRYGGGGGTNLQFGEMKQNFIATRHRKNCFRLNVSFFCHDCYVTANNILVLCTL